MITNNDALLSKFTTVYRHGIDLNGYKRHISNEFIEPEAVTTGIKGNMPDILAFLLRPQIDALPYSHAKRTANAKRYMDELIGLDIKFPTVDPDTIHAWHTFAIGVDPKIRSQVLTALDKKGIRSTIHYKPISQMKHFAEKYGYTKDDYPVSTDWGKSTFSLPIFADLSVNEQDYVIKSLKEVITSVKTSSDHLC
jgi:dTDP-4-amino-4,6-dideoxygalactose transaminase